jgi:hypothetical protein
LPADQASWRRSHFIYPGGSRRSAEGRLRPNYDVHGRDPQCPVNVDFGRCWASVDCQNSLRAG